MTLRINVISLCCHKSVLPSTTYLWACIVIVNLIAYNNLYFSFYLFDLLNELVRFIYFKRMENITCKKEYQNVLTCDVSVQYSEHLWNHNFLSTQSSEIVSIITLIRLTFIVVGKTQFHSPLIQFKSFITSIKPWSLEVWYLKSYQTKDVRPDEERCRENVRQRSKKKVFYKLH